MVSIELPGVPDQIRSVVRFLAKLVRGQFYGRVTLSFQAGRLIDIRTEQTHRPEDIG